jgi:hypothetical protein
MTRTGQGEFQEGVPQLLENWLSEQVSSDSTSASDCGREFVWQLAQQSAWERLALVREVLDNWPALDQAVRRLSVARQLRLTLEMLRGTVSTEPHSEHAASTSYLPPLQDKGHDAVYPRERTGWCVAHSRGRVGRHGGQ